MKKFLFTSLLLLTTALIAVSCDKDDPADDSVQLSVNYTQGDISAEGGTATFTITCNSSWAISNPNTWLTPDKTSGNGDATITVTVAANTGAAREGTITVKAGDKTGMATIKQLEGSASEVTLSVSYTPNDVPAAGGTETFTITSNSDWTITNPETWLTLDKTSGNGNATVNVTVAANTGAARQGTLTVKAGTKTEPVTINQLKYTSGGSGVVYDTGTTKEELFAAFEQCTLIDKDGDGHNWRVVEFQDGGGVPTGDYGIVSNSWLSTPLTPENYLILPAQTIETGAKFTVNMYAPDVDYYLEKFKLIISDQPITSANCRDAEVIYDGILTTPDRTDYVGNIPASYNNSTVYLGVCHYNSTDEFVIAIQSMTLTHEGSSHAPAPAAVKTGTVSNYSPALKAR